MATNDVVLSLRGVAKSFGNSRIIRDITMDVAPGERIALIGPNGAGKSTLFNMISGRFQPSGGDIVLNGNSLLKLEPYEIYRQGLSRSFQITNIFAKLSVYENIRSSVLWSLGHRYSLFKFLNKLTDVRERAEQLMEQVGLARRKDVLAGLLTYAEQRSLEIAMTVAGNPSVVLLDEPTAGMSRSESEQAVELIRKLTEGRTLLMVEHDMSVVFGLADRIAVLAGGALIALESPEKIRHNHAVKEAYLGDHHA
ncbi:ABC transporter ATP-binding protein [Herbaspirillum lusitanum]|uniref:ABC transporter ATP-binding protein n=1 Tax=Herbaspirillum lusitanum TaxID=213312 RepID=UPI0002E41ED6|nr:ABC transporter ATP-binding protein [Herbaspirillum lusitanum]